jgi:hypothetical protein
MKPSWRHEPDEWTVDGEKINSVSNLELLRHTLNDKGPVIVERGIYRGSSSPERMIFEYFDDVLEYLQTYVSPGDSIRIWSFMSLCQNDNYLIQGKVPDEDGTVPRKGAY